MALGKEWCRMKNIWRIYSNDLKKTGTNWVAASLIGGLILLPSLYAWFNIQASIDPYGNTRNILVGVVNDDDGAEVKGMIFNAGDEIVKELRKNQDLGWQFIDKDSGLEKVKRGDYFATIIIPEDFSRSLATVVNEQQRQAKVEYYENDKKNAIAPKITSKGASAIAGKVSSKFVGTVNGVIFDLFNQIGIELENKLPDIKHFEEFVLNLQSKLPEVKELLSQSLPYADKADNILNDVQQTIPEVNTIVSKGISIVDNTNQFIMDAESEIDSIAPTIQEDIRSLQNVTQSLQTKANQIQSVNIDPQQLQEFLVETEPLLKKGEEITGKIQNKLVKLLSLTKSGNLNEVAKNKLDPFVKSLDQVRNDLIKAQAISAELQQLIEYGESPAKSLQESFGNLIININDKVEPFIKDYSNGIEPFLTEEVLKTKQILQDGRKTLTDFATILPAVQEGLKSTVNGVHKGEEILKDANRQFPIIEQKVGAVVDIIQKMKKETNINELIELLQNDPNAESNFLANPVKIETNLLYPLPNYGSGMNPFYTVLAIWVGCLLLISLLSVDPTHSKEYSSHAIYFGRLLTFMTFSFLQTLIVTLGDIFVLKDIYIARPGWFLLFGLFSSFIFILIVFTLVSIFGNVGKAMAIVLLVLQIAGAGGTYPVQLIPKFFQMINPFLPFTYAIDLMREAVGGIVWENVQTDIICLFIFAAIAIVLGVFLKEPINRITYKLKKKSLESGLIH